ncbi:hypothetical protein BI294_10905 [Mycobacterium avium subsp. hominissuis]|nr:hypothetical protein BI294_10905 [Mycobacterium avium subsp. hominissuis]
MVESWLSGAGVVGDGAARTLSRVLGWAGCGGSLVCGSLRMASRAPLAIRVAVAVAATNTAAILLL